jgi:hypothetical protein
VSAGSGGACVAVEGKERASSEADGAWAEVLVTLERGGAC